MFFNQSSCTSSTTWNWSIKLPSPSTLTSSTFSVVGVEVVSSVAGFTRVLGDAVALPPRVRFGVPLRAVPPLPRTEAPVPF